MTNLGELEKKYRNRARQIRETRSLSLQNIADACDTDSSNISRLETGDRKLNFEWMQKIAQALDCQPYDLLPNAPTLNDQYIDTYYPLESLFETIRDKIHDDDYKSSYTAYLGHEGASTIAKKIGEEAFEVIVSSLSGDPRSRAHLTLEAADLIYHLFAILAYRKIPLSDVINELEERKEMSGFERDKQRGKKMPKFS